MPAPAAASRYPDKATRDRIDTLLGRISDAYFDYDKHELRPDAVQTLQADSKELRDILKDYPNYKLVIEGYADERGSDEYNLALGQNRASYTRNALVQDGVPASRIRVISYGKEKQFCSQMTDNCYQENRRADFVLDQ